MPDIQITIRDKIASKVDDTVYVCSNSDYTVTFDFDTEWDAYTTKTARFEYGARYIDVLFEGTTCAVPIIHYAHRVYVGVYAGELLTTTPAVIPCRKSVLSITGTPADPPEDVYAQLVTALDGKIAEPTEEGTAGQALCTDGKGGRYWGDVQGGAGGVTEHDKLTGRDADAQHPISAIEGLQAALDDKMPCYASASGAEINLISRCREIGFRPFAVSGFFWTLDGATSGSIYDVYRGSINSGVISFSMSSQGHSVYTFCLLTGDGKYYTGYVQSGSVVTITVEGAKYQTIRKVSATEDITHLPEGAYYLESRDIDYSPAPDAPLIGVTLYGLATVDADGWMDVLYLGLGCHYDSDAQAWQGGKITDGLESTDNKVTELSADSTDTEYPSAKCVYDLVGDVKTLIDNL